MVDWALGSASFSFDRFGSFGIDRVGITGRLSIKPHESGVLSVQDRGIFFLLVTLVDVNWHLHAFAGF